MSLANVLSARSKVRAVRSSVAFVLIGIFFIVCACIALRAPKADWVDAQGTVAEIQEEYDVINEETVYHVFVDYTVEGKSYTHVQYGSYHTGMQEGDAVSLQYNAANPAEIQAPGSVSIPYILIGVGVLAIVLGVVILVREVRK